MLQQPGTLRVHRQDHLNFVRTVTGLKGTTNPSEVRLNLFGEGIFNLWPIVKAFGSTLGFSFTMVDTLVLKR